MPRTAVAPRRQLLVSATVALLALPVLPLELGLGKVTMGIPIAALVVALGVRYRAFSSSETDKTVEVALALLVAWMATRLLLLQPLDGDGVDWNFVLNELGSLTAAIIMFRLARRPDLRPAIAQGLLIAWAALILLEVYQLVVGLGPLQAAGYGTENGFNYFTQTGAFRPFGTFSGPTTFGTFLAMVGLFLALTRRSVPIALVTLVAVALTDTRAAFLGVGIALGVAVAVSPQLRRSGALWVFGPLVVITSALIRPELYTGILDRVLSVTATNDTSRSTRTALWRGVIDATAQRDATWTGLANADWVQTMYGQVGNIVYVLGHAHSNFFQEWYRYGVIGMVLFAAVLVALLRVTIRGLRAGEAAGMGGLAATLVFITDSVFNNSLSSLNFVVMAFMLAGLGAMATGRPSAPIKSGRLRAGSLPAR